MTLKQTNEKNAEIKERNQMAFQLIEAEKEEAALKLLEQNHRENPSLQTVCNLAYYYLFVGTKGAEDRLWLQPQKAIEILKDFEKFEGDFFIPYSMLGHAYYQTNQYKEAKECFEKAYACDKEKGIENYSYLLYLTGEVQKAAEGFLAAYQKDENRYFMYYAHLFCTLLAGTNKDMDAEIRSLIKKTEFIPIEELCLPEVAELLFLQKDYASFIDVYDNCFDGFYISPLDFHAIAYALYQLGRDGEIKEYYDMLEKDYLENFIYPQNEHSIQLKEIYEKKKYVTEPERKLHFRLEKHTYWFD